MRTLRALPAIALLAAGCAGAPARPPAAADVVWPPAPAPARVKLVEILPSPPAPPSRWRRVLDAIVGIERAPAAPPLQRPFDVAVAPGGAVLVADPDLGEVLRLRGADAAPVACRDRPWVSPMALAIAPDGALLVADAGAAEIVRVAADGSCTAFGGGVLDRPTGVAADAQRVFVADPPRHAVVIFSREAVHPVGRRGDAEGEFDFPSAAALAPDGTLLVVDALNFRIARLSPAGAWIGAFGEAGDEGSAFARPKGVAVDREGRIYVSDAQRDLVLVFRGDGSFEYAIGGTGDAPGLFTHPAGLAIANGRLYVADSQNRRVQVFEILGERS